MLKKSFIPAAAIFAGTFCTANAQATAPTQFVKTELSCLSGTTCAVRVQLPANKLISLKAISCVNLSASVTSADIRIAKDGITYFELRLYQYDRRFGLGQNGTDALFRMENIAIHTAAKELWINLKSTVPGQMAATCYSAF